MGSSAVGTTTSESGKRSSAAVSVSVSVVSTRVEGWGRRRDAREGARARRTGAPTAADGDGDARVEGDVFERVVRFVSVRARAAWIAVVVVVAAAAASGTTPPSAAAAAFRRQDAEDGDDVVGNRARVSRIEGARANRVNECDANDASHGG